MKNYSNKYATVVLNTLQFSSRKIDMFEEKYDELRNIFELSMSEIDEDETLTVADKNKLHMLFDKDYLGKINIQINSSNATVLTKYDDSFPERLLRISDAPRVIYVLGELLPEDYISVSFVGSRKQTDYGMRITQKLASSLAKNKITIVSGMAIGIDSIAHRTALEAGGRTIAVLGSGVDVVHPKRNRQLYEKIIQNGAVISEYFFGTPPLAFRFPERNRIISALSLATVVVEAQKESGSLITARCAAQQGKEVFAVPGNIDSFYSVGTNELIKDGAFLCTSADDIIDGVPVLSNLSTTHDSVEKQYCNLTFEEQRLVDCLRVGALSVDNICSQIGYDIEKVNVMLTMLELNDIVLANRNGLFSLK